MPEIKKPLPATSAEPRPFESYKSNVNVTWCPGCGDFSVLHAMYKAMSRLNLDPKDVAVASGIGCSGRLPIFVRSYGFHGVHGRVLPLATGIKLASPQLTVLAVGGDGDGLAIGGGHFPHAARRNVDITYLMLDNSTYGLTKGQASPTTGPESSSRSLMYGTTEDNLNPIGLALAYNASFVARAFSGNMNLMIDLIIRGIQHKGFSFIHVISPCVVFNNTYPYYTSRVIPISADHNVRDKSKAIDLWQTPGKIYIGAFYEQEQKESYAQRWEIIKAKAQASGPGSMDALFSKFI